MTVTLTGAGGTGKPLVWASSLRRAVAGWDLTPGQITAFYLLVGFAALYGSDVLLVGLVADPAVLSQLQAVKGGVEVAATGGLLYVLTRGSRRSLRAKNQRLEQQQEELQVLHRVLRHNLRNDVNVVRGYATELADDLDDEEYRAWLETIIDSADRIRHYTEQAGKINKVSEADSAGVVDLAEVSRRVLGTTPAIQGATTVECAVPEAAPVRAHPMTEAAIEELVTNAVEHNDAADPALELRVDPGAGPSARTELVVRDNGSGIPAKVRRTIQDREETQLVHLDGLGLWLVAWVVSVSDGELLIDDRGTGSTVRVRLPTANPNHPTAPASASSTPPIP